MKKKLKSVFKKFKAPIMLVLGLFLGIVADRVGGMLFAAPKHMADTEHSPRLASPARHSATTSFHQGPAKEPARMVHKVKASAKHAKKAAKVAKSVKPSKKAKAKAKVAKASKKKAKKSQKVAFSK